MTKPLIKICGVRSPEIAKKAVLAGADFIGLVFDPKSRRFVTHEEAKIISQITRENGALPVGVFVEQTAAEIEEICAFAHIPVVQLHGATPRSQHHLLSKKCVRFYVQGVSPEGQICPDKEDGLSHCDPNRDYLLFDNEIPGKGKVFNWEKFHYNGHFKMILAGGLRAENVQMGIKKFRPAIVDVSGGVENAKGEKDIGMIKMFIEAVGTLS
jgi:phosphoribosylanthranilate isomerase